MSRTIATTLLVVVVGCSQPKYDAIRSDFEKSHPSCRVSSVAPGEGDSDNVYVHLKYSCGDPTDEREEVWLYQRQGKVWKSVKQVEEAIGKQ
jgi:hypothetical protein